MKTILIVDDEINIRKIYAYFLVMNGYRVIEASNVKGAKEILKTKDIHVALLDIRLPKIDSSILLYQTIKLFHRNVKVIVASVYGVDRQKEIIVGAHDYYDKTKGLNVLLRKVNAVAESESMVENCCAI